MKIYDTNLIGSSPAETGRAQESQNVSRAGSARSTASTTIDGSTDRVEFSGTMSQLSRTLATFESARATHVQALAGEADAQVAGAEILARLQPGKDAQNVVGGHREPDALAGIDGTVDADDFAADIHERPAGIAGVEGGVGLEKFPAAVIGGTPVLGADDSHG